MVHMKRLSEGEMGQEEILHTTNGVAPSASRPKDMGGRCDRLTGESQD